VLLRAARANPKDGSGVLFKIADCVRMAFDPCAIGDPRGRDAVRAISGAYGEINAAGALARYRAPTAFSARIKNIRPENAVSVSTKDGIGVLFKIADCARTAFRPRNIAVLQRRGNGARA
jgi:hypothetical protein